MKGAIMDVPSNFQQSVFQRLKSNVSKAFSKLLTKSSWPPISTSYPSTKLMTLVPNWKPYKFCVSLNEVHPSLTPPPSPTPSEDSVNQSFQYSVCRLSIRYSTGRNQSQSPKDALTVTSNYPVSNKSSDPANQWVNRSLDPVISKLFWGSMSGHLVSFSLHNCHLSDIYRNYGFFLSTSAIASLSANEAEISTQPKNQSKDKVLSQSSMSTPPPTSSSSCQAIKRSSNIDIDYSSSYSPRRFLTNSKSLRASSFRSVSIYSSNPSSSILKGKSCPFPPKLSMSSSPRGISSESTGSTRFRSESGCSTGSLVEFAASIESTDSLCIVFESEKGDCLEEDDDDDEEEDDNDDSEDDLESQCVTYSSTSEDILLEDFMFQVDGVEGEDVAFGQVEICVSKRRNRKTVSFDEENLANIVEFEDDDASKSCRGNYWMTVAIDRKRFQDKVVNIGDIIGHVLLPDHRLNIFQERFKDTQGHKIE